MSDIAPTQWPDKNPSDVADFTADFSEFLITGEVIFSSSIVPPSGITVDTNIISGQKVIIWLSGGTAGDTYEISVEIVTDASPNARTFKRYWAIRVVEKL